jgi:hypothetical protein
MKVLPYTREKLSALKTAYNEAKETSAPTFRHDRAEYLTKYTHYLIEYIETKLTESETIRKNHATTTA